MSAMEAAYLIRACKTADIDKLADIEACLGKRSGLGTNVLRNALARRLDELCQ
jgi:hypothetical protein